MTLGSLCTISNSISLEICGTKLIVTISKLFSHYSFVSLAKHCHNTETRLTVVLCKMYYFVSTLPLMDLKLRRYKSHVFH